VQILKLPQQRTKTRMPILFERLRTALLHHAAPGVLLLVAAAGVALVAFIPARPPEDEGNSLFIGSLAFEGSLGSDYAIDDRLGIRSGSILSAILGVIVLIMVSRRDRKVWRAA
jgi:Na+/H+ antiporter NhaA